MDMESTLGQMVHFMREISMKTSLKAMEHLQMCIRKCGMATSLTRLLLGSNSSSICKISCEDGVN